jgi:hypothetical protein
MMTEDRELAPVDGRVSEGQTATSLAVTEMNTVAPGLREIEAAYTGGDGRPVPGATVTITGDSKCLPVNMAERDAGRYIGVVDIPPDSDGRRDTLQVTAHKSGHDTRVAYVSYFIEDSTWVVRNDHVERRFLDWAAGFPRHIALERSTTYEGYQTYAVTVTDGSVPDDAKRKLMFTQSHAHEPGGTAAAMDAINQLLTGSSQEGEPTALDVRRILRELLIVFIPIGNASGRERSPVQYWCEHYDKEQMNRFIYGKLAAEPHQWHESPSVLRRGEQELDPAYPIALRYEQVDEDTFIEPFFAMLPSVPLARLVDLTELPNIVAHPEREPGYNCAQGRIVKTMLDRHTFTAAVDLHQMTTGGDYGQVHIREEGLEGYDPTGLGYAHAMATRMEEDGRKAGLPFAERRLINRLDWPPNITDFIHFYGRDRPAAFLIEVTKGPGTTKAAQKRIALSAILSAIGHVLDNPR